MQKTIAGAKSAVLWFEALMSSKASTVSANNAAPLANGSISGQQFMQLVQTANSAS